MVSCSRYLYIAYTPESYMAFAILCRLNSICGLQYPGWPGDSSEVLIHHGQRFLLIKLSGYSQHSIVGLIILPVKSLQVFNRHPLNVFF